MKHRRRQPEEPGCTANSADAPHVTTALEVLSHFHTHHTQDKITRFRGSDEHGKPVDIYMVSDPEWLDKMRVFVESEFSGRRTHDGDYQLMPGQLKKNATCPLCGDPLMCLVDTSNTLGVEREYHHGKRGPHHRRRRLCRKTFTGEQGHIKARDERRRLEVKHKPRKCRVCGCTEKDCRGCIARTGRPCHWVEWDLCSACA